MKVVVMWFIQIFVPFKGWKFEIHFNEALLLFCMISFRYGKALLKVIRYFCLVFLLTYLFNFKLGFKFLLFRSFQQISYFSIFRFLCPEKHFYYIVIFAILILTSFHIIGERGFSVANNNQSLPYLQK